VRLLSFPDYDTAIGAEIGRALKGERDYGPDVMQLLYVANRYERKKDIVRATGAGEIVVCDRYLASSVAYGSAQGLDQAWLLDIQKHLPRPDITFLLDMPPAVSATRKTSDRDKYERDLALLARVRENYLALSAGAGWVTLDAGRDRDPLTGEIFAEVGRALSASPGRT
jgi:dTMP kinase